MNAKIALALFAAVIAAFLLFRPRGDVTTVDAHRLVENGALLLDVRTPEEFAAGHIQGALNIPVQVLEQRMGDLGARDRDIVVYCRSGNRSGRAKQMLNTAGYTSVHDLGPMSAW